MGFFWLGFGFFPCVFVIVILLLVVVFFFLPFDVFVSRRKKVGKVQPYLKR